MVSWVQKLHKKYHNPPIMQAASSDVWLMEVKIAWARYLKCWENVGILFYWIILVMQERLLW